MKHDTGNANPNKKMSAIALKSEEDQQELVLSISHVVQDDKKMSKLDFFKKIGTVWSVFPD